jgi:hypothetical protein
MKSITPTAALLAIGALTACGGDSSTSPSAQTVAGTYVLVSVNGNPRSVGFVNGSGDSVFVLADTLFLTANATYTKDAVDSLKYSTVSGLTPTVSHNTAAGTYVLSDTLLTLTNSTTHGTASGKIVNGVLTATDEVSGVVTTGVFDKQ